MKLSFRALKKFVDFSGSAEECAEILASLGFPNDGITRLAEKISGVVLGKILEKKPHPEADRLSLLQVRVGGDQVLPIVCGASNMKVGDYVALAGVGAEIPGADGNGITLRKAKIRGEVSEGMCCSEVELGLGSESDGIWIISPEDIGPHAEDKLGQSIVDLFQLKDEIFELDITPNRGDALSVRGIARELAAKLKAKVRLPMTVRWKNPHGSVKPSIESFEDAYGFAACLVTGVKMRKSPWQWQQFLASFSQRSLGTLVDISNVVMFELGHPIHFFDADRMDPLSVHIRRARSGEKLALLNGKTIELHPEDLVVADQTGPLSLAGVMGGQASAVSEETTRVLIEVAAFNPALIRETARRHDLHSESSYRFERGLTPFRLDEILERALALLQEQGGFELATGTKIISRDIERPSCLWDRQKVESKLGKIALSDPEIFDHLRLLEYELVTRSKVPQIIFPWYRTDGQQLEDVMEDIARLIGYENLEKKTLKSEESVAVLADLRTIQGVGEALTENFVSMGFVECVHPSFSNPLKEKILVKDECEAVELINPIHAEKPILRRSILPQLIERAGWNADRGEEEIRLVEVGPVFHWGDQSVYQNSPSSESWHLACVWYPRAQDAKRLWRSSADPFFEFKGWLQKALGEWSQESSALGQFLKEEVLHPKRRLNFSAGFAGELHPLCLDEFGLRGRCFVAEFDLNKIRRKILKYQAAPSYPAIDLDVSFSAHRSIVAEKILDSFRAQSEKYLQWVRLYDIYEKDQASDSRAVTFMLRYQSQDSTLEMTQVREIHEKLVQGVLSQFPASQLALR
ncbi:MAG: phenylalanine--tRNA ligase subunit beta [Bdellovibrionota bacterium]